MIQTVEELKKERPDLVNLFESMDREQLLEQIYKECNDAINMESRVSLFMEQCTNMSKTTYTIESLKTLISEKQQSDISEFCKDLLEDTEGMSKDEIIEYIKDFSLQNTM